MQQKLIINRLYSVVCHLLSVLCLRTSTTVEDSLQIGPFMQNKPNFQKSQMNVNPYNTTNYENIANWTLGENKPNSNPNKPNFQKAQMNVNSLITKDYRKKDDFVVRINKPNFRNAQNERKRLYNKGLWQFSALRPQKNKPNSNPNKANPSTSLRTGFPIILVSLNGFCIISFSVMVTECAECLTAEILMENI